MALYHFCAKQVKRSAGQSVVAASAYRAGEKLHCDYYGQTFDYTHKGGVVHQEIILPENAPREYSDRATLWNAVEQVEKNKNAQLAYSFDIALQNELPMEENISLVRTFVTENFVSRGMIVDLAVHEPHKEEEEKENPHFHVLAPIRPILPDGSFGTKQYRQYKLDEKGNRLRKQNGVYDFDAIATTDWGTPETLEQWRENWANLVNEKFEEKGIKESIDHRSFERQGMEEIPTVHEGPTVRAMEKKGIRTRKGDLNRFIRSTNQLLIKLKEELVFLASCVHEIRQFIKESQVKEPMIPLMICDYYDKRNQGAYSSKAKVNNVKAMSQKLNFLRDRNITTLSSFEIAINKLSEKVSDLNKSVKKKETRISELSNLIRRGNDYQKYKPIYDEWYGIRNQKRKDAYEQEHHAELTLYQVAKRELSEHLSGQKINISSWKKEKETLQREKEEQYTEYCEYRDERKQFWEIKMNYESVLPKEIKNIQRSIAR